MDVFAQRRTYRRAALLGVSQLACLGPHTVTGLLSVAGKQEADWTADYRFFSQDRWRAQELFDSVLGGILDFLPAGGPLVAAMDDTLLPKSGTHIPDVSYRRDPLSPHFHPNFIRGQRFLQVSALLPERPQGPGPARAIPVRYQPAPPLPKPPARAGPAERREFQLLRRSYNLSTLGRDAIAATRQQLDAQEGGAARLLVLGVDGSYTNQTVLRNLPPRTVLIGRIRKDAQLCYPVVGPPQPHRGCPRRYGPPLPTPQALRQDDGQPWQVVRAFAAGKVHDFRVKTVAPVLWPKAGPAFPLRLIVIAPLAYRLRQGSRLLYRQPAYLICTDPHMPVEEAVQDYLWRWGIEVDHRDEKQLVGVGEAQVRCPDSARREPIFAVACYAKLLLAAAQRYGPDATQADLPLPKWRRNRPGTRLTTGDLIRQVRQDLWGDALRQVERNYRHFVNAPPPSTNGLKLDLSLRAAVDHAATG
jgi:hypothetical protein